MPNIKNISDANFAERYREVMVFLSRCSVVLLLYGVAASMAIANIGAVMMLVFWILSLEWTRSWSRLLKLPAFWPLVLIPLLVLLGTFYTVAPIDYAYRYFGVYSRFLIVLVIVAVISDVTWQRRCWGGFFVGAAVALISTYLSIWFVLPWSQSQSTGLGVNHSVFYDYIAQGVMTSFLAVVALSHALSEKYINRRLWWMFILSVSVFSITHLLMGRTGQIVCALALMGVIFVALPPRRALMIAIILLFFIFLLVFTSPVISQRFALLISEMQGYQQGQEMTSIGARLAMWNASLGFYMDQPLWGHGTGSYRWLAERVFIDPVMCQISCVHPHNQFLFFGVEHGIPGFLIYGWLFLAVGKIAMQIQMRPRLIISGLLVILAVDSFINSPFWISSERNFYTAILALTLTSFYLNKISPSGAGSR